ncbi:MAG: hypothetical protein Q8L24_02120 [bacterium]|nr:hypothetical protein [bacterium]
MNQLHEWQINFQEYLRRLQLNERGFRNELSLPVVGGLELVIPLKDIRRIASIVPVPNRLLTLLLRKITTLEGGLEPFRSSSFQLLKVDPTQLMIGQKFAYRENYVQLLEELADIFREKYAINSGITNLGAFMVFGEDAEEKKAMAFYLPPIVEQHGAKLVVMDGIHRNFITLQMGATINAILVREVGVPFPCSPHSWQDLKVINLAEKPKDLNERYFDLNKSFFRDLKHFGIDG